MTIGTHPASTSRATAPAAFAGSARFEIRPFDAPLGAEIVGLDLAEPLSAEDFARIHRAHLDYHVVVFELVQRDGYLGFGAANASLRMAAQALASRNRQARPV